ncbi:hypothetical protein TNCV_3940361 [Trichonephila clavipes]|uniref:Uncharacterized protein n=1 Tax=Trichonephila clavipes TaxID=2585209 RepID=A0A8X7B8D5_TRICX|nr:hypothetical protein TNCV_3940361 [Trichonephila clavipes]
MSHQEKNRKHINSLQSLNDAIHWSPSTLNVPSGKKRKHINSLQSLNDVHWSSIRGEKTKHIQFSQSLNDAIHWSFKNVPKEKKHTSILSNP